MSHLPSQLPTNGQTSNGLSADRAQRQALGASLERHGSRQESQPNEDSHLQQVRRGQPAEYRTVPGQRRRASPQHAMFLEMAAWNQEMYMAQRQRQQHQGQESASGDLGKGVHRPVEVIEANGTASVLDGIGTLAAGQTPTHEDTMTDPTTSRALNHPPASISNGTSSSSNGPSRRRPTPSGSASTLYAQSLLDAQSGYKKYRTPRADVEIDVASLPPRYVPAEASSASQLPPRTPIPDWSHNFDLTNSTTEEEFQRHREALDQFIASIRPPVPPVPGTPAYFALLKEADEYVKHKKQQEGFVYKVFQLVNTDEYLCYRNIKEIPERKKRIPSIKNLYAEMRDAHTQDEEEEPTPALIDAEWAIISAEGAEYPLYWDFKRWSAMLREEQANQLNKGYITLPNDHPIQVKVEVKEEDEEDDVDGEAQSTSGEQRVIKEEVDDYEDYGVPGPSSGKKPRKD